jgi:hypothetical protein
LGLSLKAESESHTLCLRNCTYHTAGDEGTHLIRLAPTAKVDVEATGNVIHCRAPVQLIDPTMLPQVTWTGSGNCFSRLWYQDPKPDEQPLPEWNKLWQQPERDSYGVRSLAFEWGRIQQFESKNRVQDIRAEIEKLPGRHQLPTAGPDWELLGPGDAYLRALATEGRAVPLRPSPLEGGAIALIRSGQEVRGYITLKEAIDASQDKDIVEIRTDGASY